SCSSTPRPAPNYSAPSSSNTPTSGTRTSGSKSVDRRSEESVAGVAEARGDVTDAVEFGVERRGHDRDVGMFRKDVVHARLGRDQAQCGHVAGAAGAQHVEDADHRTPG